MGTHPIFESDFDCLTEMTEELEANPLYESLSREAEALKSRPEATEERMENLQRKLSNGSVDVPVAPPRRSLVSLVDKTSESDQRPEPTAPELGDGPTYDELKERLEIVEKMNRDWVAYNENREIFVQQLTAQNHETTHQLRLAVEEIQKLQQNSGKFFSDERKKMDQTLLDSRAEIEKLENLSETLREKVTNINTKYLSEVEKRREIESELSQVKGTLSHLESINEKLTKTIRKDRRKSDLNSARLEASISQLSKEVTKFSGSSVATSVVSSNQSSPRKYRAPPRPESPKVPPRPKGLKEKTKALDQRRSWSPRATSPSPSSSPKKKIITPLSPSVAKSRRSMDSHAISCENCGLSWPVSQHNLLLAHIDECDAI